jgi:hypothetical protein
VGEGSGASAGPGDGVSVADGDSLGVGAGDAFLRFDLLLGVAVGDGLGEAFFRFGEVSGDGVGVAFFFRCFRVGVGDGSNTFLIFVPSDSWAAWAGYGAPNRIAIIKSHFMTRFCSVRCPQRRFERAIRVGCAETAHATVD